MEFIDGFQWQVPKAFSEPIWFCRFEEGDILYDTPLAYEGSWSDALSHLKMSIQVNWPKKGLKTLLAAANPEESEDSEEIAEDTSEQTEKLFIKNWFAPLGISITEYPTKKSHSLKSTQGRLYSLLWKGDVSILDESTTHPPLPRLAASLLSELKSLEGFVREYLPSELKTATIFLMPADSTGAILIRKKRKIRDVFSQAGFTEFEFTPKSCGLETNCEFAPTVSIAGFIFKDQPSDIVKDGLKKALYVPAKKTNKKKRKGSGKERFSLGPHGHLFSL